MIESMSDMKKALENNPKQYNLLMDVISRDIPLTGFQANLMYLNRGYGKSWMSYIHVAQKCMSHLKDNKTVSVGDSRSDINPNIYDIDIRGKYQRLQHWINCFEVFAKDYYPELVKNMHKSNSMVLVFTKKEMK